MNLRKPSMAIVIGEVSFKEMGYIVEIYQKEMDSYVEVEVRGRGEVKDRVFLKERETVCVRVVEMVKVLLDKCKELTTQKQLQEKSSSYHPRDLQQVRKEQEGEVSVVGSVSNYASKVESSYLWDGKE